jgi:hypothetical protein
VDEDCAFGGSICVDAIQFAKGPALHSRMKITRQRMEMSSFSMYIMSLRSVFASDDVGSRLKVGSTLPNALPTDWYLSPIGWP